MADYAIHDTTLIGISNVIRKKEGSSALIDPAEYAERVNLMGLLEEKTASGSIVTFADGADDVPLKSCEVALSASLDGYSSVDVVSAGKNLFTDENKVNGYLNADGDLVNASGWYVTDYIGIVPSTEYTFTSGSSAGASPRTILYDKSKTMVQAINTGNRTFTTPSTAYYIRISYRSTDTDIQLEVGSTASTYEQYVAPTTHTASLGCTIYGGQADIVNGEGQETHAKIDMGDLTWQYDSVNTRFFTVGLTGVIKRGASGWITDLAVSSPYTVVSGTANDKTISEYASTGYVYIKDTDYTDPTTFKTSLSGKYLTYPLATPENFTFTGQEVPTRLGYNAFWSDSGDTEVTYRSSGTVTPIQPTLISKSITANGTYTASDDGVDGYDTVEVSVPSPVIEPILGNNVFVSQNGVSGTDVERTARTFNITKDGKIIFADGSYGYTNTSSNHGYIDIRHNDVSVVKQYLTTDTNTSITIPDIDVENGDTVTVVVGFDSNHSSCYFQLYSAMVMVSEASAPSLLSMMPSEEVNENEEVEENEQNDIEG